MEIEGECREMRLENTTVRKECVLHTERERNVCFIQREREECVFHPEREEWLG